MRGLNAVIHLDSAWPRVRGQTEAAILMSTIIVIISITTTTSITQFINLVETLICN